MKAIKERSVAVSFNRQGCSRKTFAPSMSQTLNMALSTPRVRHRSTHLARIPSRRRGQARRYCMLMRPLPHQFPKPTHPQEHHLSSGQVCVCQLAIPGAGETLHQGSPSRSFREWTAYRRLSPVASSRLGEIDDMQSCSPRP